MICGMARRNQYHECISPVSIFKVKRLIDGMEGNLTICESEMNRLVEINAFRLLQQKEVVK